MRLDREACEAAAGGRLAACGGAGCGHAETRRREPASLEARSRERTLISH